MANLEELRKAAEANRDKSICDPCQQKVTEIKYPPAPDYTIRQITEGNMTPHERRLERARLALGDPIPHGQHRIEGIEPLRICVVDDEGVATFRPRTKIEVIQYVDPRITMGPKGMRLSKHDRSLGGIRGDC